MTGPSDSSQRNLPQRFVAPALPQLRDQLGHAPDAGRKQLSLKDYLYILRRRKWLPVAVTATVLAVSALQIFTTTSQYTALARIQIDPGEAEVLPYQDIAGPGRALASDQYVWTQAERLRSRDLARRVVERLDLESNSDFNARTSSGAFNELVGMVRGLARRLVGSGAPPAPASLAPDAGPGEDSAESPSQLRMEQMESKLIGRLQIRPLRRTRLIEIGFVSPSPKLAAAVANTVAEEFIDLHLQNRYEATIRATDFLQRQLGELKERVEVSEAALLEYAKTKNIVTVSETETVNRKRFTDLSDERTRLYNELVAARARYDAVRTASGRSLPEQFKDDRIRDLEARMSQLEGELSGYSSRYGSEWPAVKEKRSEIAGLEAQLADARRRAVYSAEQDYLLARDRHDRIATAMSSQRQVVDRLDDDSIEYKILQGEVESNKSLYQGLLLRLKEAGVAASLESSNIQIADRAITPRVASYPKKTQGLIRALLLGLFLGLASVVLAENLDNTVKTPEDIDHFVHLPCLGVVPALFAETPVSLWSRLFRRKSEDTEPPAPALIFDQEGGATTSRAWEAYRSLRTSVLLSSPEQAPKVLLVTSALPGEGKSTTAVNTAVAFAQTGARTLLLDLDLRRPKLRSVFGLKAVEGMTTYLTGNANLSTLVQGTQVPNLYIVVAGPSAPNPPELLGSERMRVGLALARDFDHIVIDSPPCLELSDSIILSLMVDGVILVAKAGKTPRNALAEARDKLVRVQAPLLGVALNAVDIRGPSYGHYYGGYYGAYYGTQGDDGSELSPKKRTA